MYEDATEPFLKEGTYSRARGVNILKGKKSKSVSSEVETIMMNGFIRKVYGLLMVQMLIIFGVCIFANYNKTFQYLLSFRTLLVLDFIILIGIAILLMVDIKLFMKVPLNYFLLLLFTLSFSWIIARETYKCKLQNVIISFCLTILTVFILTIYTFFTKRKVKMAVWAILISFILIIVSIFLYIFLRIRILILFMNILCVVIFSLYLVYDTERILTTRGGTLVFADAYILAVMLLFIDIIYIFLSYLGTSKS
jgi:FtsH-binding integral membrane protein